MKDLSYILLEKLRINKDTKIAEKEITRLTDLYEVGDRCFFMKDRGLQSQERITIDVVEITEKTKTILRYKYLTHINSDITTSFLEINRNDNLKVNQYKCAYTSGTSTTTCILPVNMTKEVLEIIEQVPELDFNDLIYKEKSYGRSNHLTKVMELKDIKLYLASNQYSSYRMLTKESVNTYKDFIK